MSQSALLGDLGLPENPSPLEDTISGCHLFHAQFDHSCLFLILLLVCLFADIQHWDQRCTIPHMHQCSGAAQDSMPVLVEICDTL